MIPESRLIRSELTIRELALPEDVLLAKKSLVRWLALSLGLIMPNESRKLLLDILEVLIEFHLKKQNPTTKDIILRLEEMTNEKQNPKAIYYHLQRIKNMGLLNRKKGRYMLGNGEEKTLSDIFKAFYIKQVEQSFGNISTALVKLEKSYYS